MRIRVVLAILIAAALVVLAYGADDQDISAMPYDKTTELMIDGRLLSRGHALEVCEDGVFISVEGYEVYLGPSEYVRRFMIKLNIGEEVTVVGAPVRFREKNILMARSVTTGSRMLILRDREGRPNWLDLPVHLDPECMARPHDEARFYR